MLLNRVVKWKCNFCNQLGESRHENHLPKGWARILMSNSAALYASGDKRFLYQDICSIECAQQTIESYFNGM